MLAVKKKGIFAAISKLEHFIRSESKNGAESCFILKLDIKGFFMSIPRQKLCKKLEDFIDEKIVVLRHDNEFLKSLVRKIVLTDPTQNCIRRSPAYLWKQLPFDKSLFTCKKGCGLPIGNLTSQVFANFYLTEFDHFIKHTLQVKNYVRYVDDFVIVHKDEKYLKMLIPEIRKFLEKNLELKLHPNKIYLQKACHGVEFLGSFIKPSHTVSGRRIKRNFVSKLQTYENLAESHKPTGEEKNAILSSVNSYLGIFRHYKSYKFRTTQLIRHFKNKLKKHFSLKSEALKIERRN